MSDYILSTNMNMPIPVVGVDPGPDYATNLNSSLSLVDVHDHSSGKGVQISPSGINISSDLPFNNNNLTQARSLRLYTQSAVLAGASDVNCLYNVGVDLYYNDGNGNNIRITQSSAVAGTPGSISNLVSPASASYSSLLTKFIWQSGANLAADLDCRSIILRNSGVSSYGMTVSPPAAMGSDSSITLPNIPAAQKIVTMDASGNMAAVWGVDNSTTAISSNNIIVKDGGITPVKTTCPLTASSSSGTFTGTATTPTAVTNLTATITTIGNPVTIFLQPDGSSSPIVIGAGSSGTTSIYLYRDGSSIAQYAIPYPNSFYGFSFLDQPSAGSHTYDIRYNSSSGSVTSVVLKAVLVVREW